MEKGKLKKGNRNRKMENGYRKWNMINGKWKKEIRKVK
jgi:hypothetical protein